MAEDVLTIDHAPVVGEVYSVPTVEAAWDGNFGQWPVIQAAPHTDVGRVRDWHLDYRFLTPAQEALAAAVERRETIWDHMSETGAPNRWPGSRAARQLTLLRLGYQPDFPPAVFRDLVCRRPTLRPEPLSKPWDDLHARYGTPADAICTPSGRHLCPHQKMDLTHWPREADGTVICPLHRLRVRVPA